MTETVRHDSAPPYRQAVDAVISALTTDALRGLSEAEARKPVQPSTSMSRSGNSTSGRRASIKSSRATSEGGLSAASSGPTTSVTFQRV